MVACGETILLLPFGEIRKVKLFDKEGKLPVSYGDVPMTVINVWSLYPGDNLSTET